MAMAQTGYTSDQPYNTGDYTGKWKVLYVDTNKIEIISEGSVGNLYLQGKDGYNNLVSTLNTMSSYYINTSYANTARGVGSNRTDPAGRSELFTSPFYAYIEQYANDYIKNDSYYMEDITAMENANTKALGEKYWLAGRDVVTSSTAANFNGRYVLEGGTSTSYYLMSVSSWR